MTAVILSGANPRVRHSLQLLLAPVAEAPPTSAFLATAEVWSV